MSNSILWGAISGCRYSPRLRRGSDMRSIRGVFAAWPKALTAFGTFGQTAFLGLLTNEIWDGEACW